MLYTVIKKHKNIEDFLMALFSFARTSSNKTISKEENIITDWGACAMTFVDKKLTLSDDLESHNNFNGCAFRTIYDIHQICIVHYPKLTLKKLGEILGKLCINNIFTYDFCEDIDRIVFYRLPTYMTHNRILHDVNNLNHLGIYDKYNRDCTFDEFCELLNIKEHFND